MEGSTLKLTVEKGPREGETVECTTRSVIKIGRVVRGNTFTIKDSGISSKHLVIEFKNSKWVISDLDTSNGTFLNGITLRPLTDFDLRDEDVIKIGEWTSIKVKIVEEEIKPAKSSKKTSKKESVDVGIAEKFDAEIGEEHQLRRNPRRGAAPRKNTRASKDETSESALVSVSKVQKTSANPNLGLDNCGGRENVASVADSRPRRGRPRKLKDESVVVQKISENSELGQEFSKESVNVVPIGEKRTRRGAPRKLRGSKDEQVTTSEVQKISENSSAAEPVNCTEVSNVAEKTRVSKEDEPSESVSDMQKGLQNLSFEHQESCEEPENLAPIEKKQTRRVAQRRVKASEDEPSESVQIAVPEAPENNPKQSNLEQETCKESVSTSAARDNLVPENDETVGNGIDWEKMTLGQWFDYLEVNLPKQLHEITDEIISSMRERSKQFNEFMLQQQQGKGKLPMI